MSELPTGWQPCSVSDFFGRLQYGYTAKADTTGLGPKFLRITDIRDFCIDWTRVPGAKDANDCERYLLCDGDFVFARSGSIEKACRITNPPTAIFASYLIRGKPLCKECADWFALFIKSDEYREQVFQRAAGIGMSNVNAEKLGTINFPLPPLPEQHRIVAKFDSLSVKSKRARDHLDHLPRLVEKYKAAVLNAAFRGGLTQRWNKGSENTPAALASVREQRKRADLSEKRRAALAALPTPTSDLPDLPTSWAWVCIEELASDEPRAIQSGPFGSSLRHSEFQPEGFLVIGIDNVQDGVFSPGSQNRISKSKFEELERFRARPLDVLITVMATIGRTCVVPEDIEPALITKHVYRIGVDSRLVLPRYLMNALRGSEVALQQMGANVRGQTRPGINGEILKRLFVPVAPLTEQSEILRRVDSAFAWIDRLAAEATSARKMIDHLDQAILSKAFRGELVPQDPNDEPASALLEKLGRADRGIRSKDTSESVKAT